MALRKNKAEARAQKAPGNKGKDANARPSSAPEFPVIGIGASAGGLDAFVKFFSNMPVDTGMAFVLVQHLDPRHTSSMVEILRRQTKMPVAEAGNDMKLEPDHVYMIPPNKNMTITSGTLRLEEQLERPGIMHSIDLFFRSLASDLKEKAICVILSGTGSDGALGARAVKAELGMVMVQDPDTAAYDGMPRAAIAAGVADFVLPAEKMAQQLVEYVQKSFGKRVARRREVEWDSSGIDALLSLVRARTRHDFSGYKQTTINRRVERRMGINQIDNISLYLQYIREHPEEVDLLVKDFLINVTSFFRDPEAFTALKEHLKKLVESKAEGSELRAWVPGCSTGEEAYSIAMIIEEALSEAGKYCQVQVFGSDMDRDAVAVARNATYPSSIAVDVGEERLKRFFTREDDGFQVRRDLREKLVFAVHDIITDPPFTRMDLVSARNLLIYFSVDLQGRLVPMFHYALKQGGLLFLGTAETVGVFSDRFSPVDRRWKIYRAEAGGKQAHHTPFRQLSWEGPLERGAVREYAVARPNLLARSPEQALLEALPATVLLDRDCRVIYSHGDTRRYLGFPEGRPNSAILEIAHPEIRAALATAIGEAAAQGRPVVREGLRVKVNGDTRPFKLTVRPVSSRHEGEPKGRLTVTFEDMPEVKPRHRKAGADEESRVVQLEQELQHTKETLRSTIEELETANEELRSANEEYQSTNEELQSTNEELETSREELQSVNEELSTVNSEHQAKIEELSTVNDDMKNLLNATGIATIYLDNDLKIKRFTPAATRVVNLIPSDAGRPIGHITSQMRAHDVAEQAAKVLDDLIPVEEDVQARDGKWYTMRILPYRTTDNSIAGAVVTFIDITGEKTARESTRAALSYSEAIVNTLFQPVVVLGEDLKVVSANQAFYETFNVRRNEVERKRLYDMDGPGWSTPEMRKLLEEMLPRSKVVQDYRLEGDFARVGHRKLRLNARRLRDHEGAPERIMLAIDDAAPREG